jgi:hypothetical protein
MGQWWGDRPWHKRRWMPSGMSTDERNEWETKRYRAYYETHRSARLARWGFLVGVIVATVGTSFADSFSRVTADLGDGVQVLGGLIIVVSFSVPR